MPLAARVPLACLVALCTFSLNARAADPPFLGTHEARATTTPERQAPGGRLAFSSLPSGWTPTPPTLDGTVDAAEWRNAQEYQISFTATPIYLYLMNDANYLYVAIDDQVDPTVGPGDQQIVLFDDEGGTPPSLGDGTWNAASCPSSGGAIAYGDLAATGAPADNIFQGMSTGGPCVIEVEPGENGAYGTASGTPSTRRASTSPPATSMPSRARASARSSEFSAAAATLARPACRRRRSIPPPTRRSRSQPLRRSPQRTSSTAPRDGSVEEPCS